MPDPHPATAGPPRVVVIGAGFGGLAAAGALRRAPVHLTWIDRRNHHLFQPLLYQVATAALEPADIAQPIRQMARGRDNVEVVMGEVRGIDLDRRLVLLDDVEAGGDAVPYDYLVVATGSEFHYFGHDEWAAHAPGLKSIEDAITIRRRMLLALERAELCEDAARRRRLLTFVAVGGGPTGVEMAGAIADVLKEAFADFRHIRRSEMRVVLVEAGPRLLPAFPEDLSAYTARALERLGVEVRLNAMVEAVDAGGVTVAGGERIEGATVIWSAGVRASPAGKWLGAETDEGGRVKVGRDLSLPGRPEVFVVGDTALALDGDGAPLPGLAPVAKQQGRHAARIILAAVEGRENERPAFVYRNWGNLATIGWKSAVADFGWLRLKGVVAWLLWGFVHVFFLIDFRNRMRVMVEWIYQYFTFRRGARLITRQG
ncbi:MAG TPA: NAD(P)/FAD-dependent oxidoreductase [Geminicoccaceae bacterium]|nr:NAD(P)/FAD-dependent oxidoreductase [Geminicoccaceae bacterium]